MTNTVRDVILARWKSDFDNIPRLKPIRAALESALNAHDAVRERHTSLSKNQNLSSLGRLDDVRAFVSKSTAPIIHRGRATARAARQDVAAWQVRLQPPSPDPKNVAAAVLRSEMRTQLRGLSQSARYALLLSETIDPTLAQAVLEAPNFSSGVTDEIRGRMVEIIINHDHPEQLAQIAQVEEAIKLLDAATGITMSTAKSIGEFPNDNIFADFIDKSAPLAKPSIASDPMVHLNNLPKPPSEPEKTPEELVAASHAWARAEVARMRAAGEFD
jgi:hypothetical protein